MSLLLTDNFWKFWIYIPHKYYAWLLPFKGNKNRRSKPDISRISETRPVVIEDVILTVNGSFFCLSVISKQKLEWPESYLLFLQTTNVLCVALVPVTLCHLNSLHFFFRRQSYFRTLLARFRNDDTFDCIKNEWFKLNMNK